MESNIQALLAEAGNISIAMTYVTRFIFPLLALIIFVRCLLPLMSGGRQPAPWAYLVLQGGDVRPLSHWENSVGRSNSCDVVLNMNFISRVHAVITRKGNKWYISDLDSKGGVSVNGENISGNTRIDDDDIIKLAGLEMKIIPAEFDIEESLEKKNIAVRIAERAAYTASNFSLGNTLLFILLFQFLGLVNICLAAGEKFDIMVPIVFLLFFALELFYFVFTGFSVRKHIEPELLAFFLSGISLFVCASVNPSELIKQFAAIVIGIALLLVLTFFLNNLERARVARYVFAIASIVLLIVTLLIATATNGALNWIHIGGVSIQPSEFVKVAFVFAGGATLERLLSSKNFFKYMVFSGICIVALILMSDFGAALIFYIAFIVITFMRSGDLRRIGLITGVAVAGVPLSYRIFHI